MESQYCYNLTDTVVLQLCDLWAWVSPQLSALVILVVAFGGVVGNTLAGSGGSGGGPVWACLPWPAVLSLLLAVAVPVTAGQKLRRRAMLASDYPASSDTSSSSLSPSEAALRAAEVAALSARVTADAHRIETFAAISGWLLGANPADGDMNNTTTATSTESNGNGTIPSVMLQRLLGSPLGAGIAAAFFLQFTFAVAAPSLSLGPLLGLVAGPGLAASLAVTGGLRLLAHMRSPPQEGPTPSINTTTATTAAAAASSGEPTKQRRSSPALEPLGDSTAAVNSGSGASTPPPLITHNRAASSSAALGSITTAPALRYALPALTDRESVVADQISNLGAPFSLVLLKPLREWNQVSGWETVWERDGLRCEERIKLGASGGGGGRADGLDMRVTANVPHANVGTLQALLLDDPDFRDSKGTFAYQFTPQLSQRCIVRRLAYNTLIMLTRLRSPVYGVPPMELLQYFSPAILLDPEQQRALELRRPFSNSNNNASPAASLTSAGEPKRLMAFVQCAIPCPYDLHTTPPCQPPHVRGPTEYSFIVGMEEADGSLTLGLYSSIDSKGVVPRGWDTVYRSAMVRKAAKLAELAGQEGPKPNQLADYVNRRDFQPFLDRQAMTETEASSSSAGGGGGGGGGAAATAAQSFHQQQQPARRMANLSREAQIYASGTALFTTDNMEVAVPTPVKRGTLSFDYTNTNTNSSSVSPVAAGVPTTAAHMGSMSGEMGSMQNLLPRLPKVPERVVAELIALQGWTPEASNNNANGNTLVWTCPTPFTARRATRTLIRVPGASLALAEGVLLSDHLAPRCNPSMERVVTVTPANLPGLLMNAVVPGKSSTTAAATAVAPDFPRESYHGCSIRYMQLRSQRWGVAPRDTVTRVAEPYYFSAGDARRHLFSPEQFATLPAEAQGLPDSTRMFLFCGEDAGDVLPPMKQYHRGRVFLFGYLCWENSSSSNGGGGGVTIMADVVSQPSGGRLPGKLSDRSIADQQRVMVSTKEVIERIAGETTAR